MTQDEIIRMAREAGFETCGTTGQLFNKDLEGYCQEELERFAALVEQRVRSEIALEELTKQAQEQGEYK